VLELEAEAAQISKALLAYLKIPVRVQHGDGTHYTGYGSFDSICVALEAGNTREAKEGIFRQIAAQAGADTNILVRGSADTNFLNVDEFVHEHFEVVKKIPVFSGLSTTYVLHCKIHPTGGQKKPVAEGAFDYPAALPSEAISSYARKLARAFINPESGYHSARRSHYGKSREEWDRAYQRSDAYPYPKTVWDINCGHCEEFAEALKEAFPGGEVLDLAELYINDTRYLPAGFDTWDDEAKVDWIAREDLPAHAVYFYHGKYYDAQNPDGVSDWARLDLMRYGGGLVTRNEYLLGKRLEALINGASARSVVHEAAARRYSSSHGSTRY